MSKEPPVCPHCKQKNPPVKFAGFIANFNGKIVRFNEVNNVALTFKCYLCGEYMNVGYTSVTIIKVD